MAWRETAAVALDHATSSEVAWQVFQRNGVETPHPEFEAAMVGVDVLDVITTNRAFAGTGNERHLGDADCCRKRLTGPIVVGDAHGVFDKVGVTS